MNIPQEAIDAARASPAGHLPTEAVERMLKAALPHLLADHRERLAKDVVTLTAMAEDSTALPERCAFLAGKARGVEMSLSKLDEMLRS